MNVILTTETLRRLAQAILKELDQIELEGKLQQTLVLPTAPRTLNHSQDDWAVLLGEEKEVLKDSDEMDSGHDLRLRSDEKGLYKLMRRHINEAELKSVFVQKRTKRISKMPKEEEIL